MNPNIKPESLSAVEQYLETINEVDYNPYGFSGEEINVIFPTISLLFDFGHGKYGSSANPQGPPNFQHFSAVTKSEPSAARNTAINQTGLLTQLLTEYRGDEILEKRHILFDTQIGNMTGYQFEQYLKEIGIIND